MLCPSAPPERAGGVLFGVVGGGATGSDLVAYLKEPQPVTDEVLALAAPLPPAAVLRFAAGCAESACAHYDGHECRLAEKVVVLLPPVVSVLPPCAIRSKCRWWAQEGRAACVRCPAIATRPADAGEALRRAADPAVAVQPSS